MSAEGLCNSSETFSEFIMPSNDRAKASKWKKNNPVKSKESDRKIRQKIADKRSIVRNYKREEI